MKRTYISQTYTSITSMTPQAINFKCVDYLICIKTRTKNYTIYLRNAGIQKIMFILFKITYHVFSSNLNFTTSN